MPNAPRDRRSPEATAARRLTADDWADEALTALGEGGLAAVAVEPLAIRLGATKGSFYWHFPNRIALVEAALARWEVDHTDGVIALMADEPDPAERLRRLLRLVVGVSRHDRIEMALLASADDPVVAPVLARVTERRIDYVASLYRELGLSPAAARRRAVVALSMYLGHVQLARAAPDALPSDARAWRRHLDEIVETLLPPS